MEALTRVRRGRTSAGIRSAARSRSCTRRRRFLQGRWGPAKQDWPDVGKLVAASNSSDGRRARVHRGGGAQLLCCSGDDSRMAFSSGGDGSSWCSAGPVRDSLKVRRGGRLGRAALPGDGAVLERIGSTERCEQQGGAWPRGSRRPRAGDATAGHRGFGLGIYMAQHPGRAWRARQERRWLVPRPDSTGTAAVRGSRASCRLGPTEEEQIAGRLGLLFFVCFFYKAK